MTPRKSDRNQPEIVAELRKIGYLVQDLHRVGKGCPDILVGAHGQLYLFEIKSDAGKLTDDEIEWHARWHDYPVWVVRSTDEIVKRVEGF